MSLPANENGAQISNRHQEQAKHLVEAVNTLADSSSSNLRTHKARSTWTRKLNNKQTKYIHEQTTPQLFQVKVSSVSSDIIWTENNVLIN